MQLYPYNKENDLYHCPLSQDDNNDTIRDYCKAEIKEILKSKGNSLNDSVSHLDQVYLRYVGSLLDHSIGQEHSESGFPEISFGEILSIIETETSEDEVYEMKKNLTYRWEKYHGDYASDIREEDFKLMDEINNHLLSLTKDEFYEFVRMMLPHENSDEKFLELFRNAPMEDIFYVLLEKIKGFSFKSYSYLDDNEKSYRTSLISIQDRPGIIAIKFIN
ncbi:ABC-three component system protein, partial [Streptococcus pneumoniae]